jgi:hypothetical protein
MALTGPSVSQLRRTLASGLSPLQLASLAIVTRSKGSNVISCHYCASENIQRLTILISAGTQKINLKSFGDISGSSHGPQGYSSISGSTMSKTEGTTQTTIAGELAKKFPEPKLESEIGSFLSALIGFYVVANIALEILGFFFGFALPSSANGFAKLGILAVSFVLARSEYRRTRLKNESFPQRRRQWDSSYFCHRCGEVSFIES